MAVKMVYIPISIDPSRFSNSMEEILATMQKNQAEKIAELDDLLAQGYKPLHPPVMMQHGLNASLVCTMHKPDSAAWSPFEPLPNYVFKDHQSITCPKCQSAELDQASVYEQRACKCRNCGYQFAVDLALRAAEKATSSPEITECPVCGDGAITHESWPRKAGGVVEEWSCPNCGWYRKEDDGKLIQDNRGGLRKKRGEGS